MDVCIIDAIIQTSMNNAIKYVQQYDDIHKCKAVASPQQHINLAVPNCIVLPTVKFNPLIRIGTYVPHRMI